jgi:hypothetical protein
MEKGTLEQLEEMFVEMPDAKQISPERWVELFSIQSRLTNYYAPEQTRVDQYVISFMPLVQKDVLNLLFGLSEADKKNGRMFKQLIRQNSDQLTKQPLVKGNITHPFNSSSLGSRFQSRIKDRLSLGYRSMEPIKLLHSIKEFINDLTHSSEVRNCEFYDQKKVERIWAKFSLQSNEYNSEIDWFLSFELFRKGISK